METLFLTVVNISLTAGWLVLAVFVLRLIFHKAPKWIFCLLWGLVAFRLVVPMNIESPFSLIPSNAAMFTGSYSAQPYFADGTQHSVHFENIMVGVDPFTGVSVPEDTFDGITGILGTIWLLGMGVMLLYSAGSYLLLRARVSTATLLRDNIRQSENVGSPFVLGFFKPLIYLPYRLDEEELVYIVAHEQAHIRRKDHWWKPIGFLILCVYWFNPLMWVAYSLLCRDIEGACDEKVVRDMEEKERQSYSAALLNCSVHRRIIAACPLAFGETGVKGRIRNVMNYKKPAFWVILLAIIACIAAAVCFLTNPESPSMNVLPLPSIHSYSVETVYYGISADSVKEDGKLYAPAYYITEEMVLMVQHDVSSGETWSEIGALTQIELSKNNFDTLFKNGRWQLEQLSASKIRKENAYAWSAEVEGVLYYVLQQKDGEIQLAVGEKNKTSIGWLYRLIVDVSKEKGISVAAGEEVIPVVVYPAGTVIGNYIKGVYWLEIDPKSTGLPFTVTCDGEPVTAHYTAFDATSFDPLPYQIYQDTDSQRFLFENAEAGKEYVVVISRSTEPEAPICCFGVRYGDAEQLDAEENREEAISAAILEHSASERDQGLIHVESHRILAQSRSGSKETVYLIVRYQKYSTLNAHLEEKSGGCIPTAITVEQDQNGQYTVLDYWEPRDGSFYDDDIRGKFPMSAQLKLYWWNNNDAGRELRELEEECLSKAQAQMNSEMVLVNRLPALLEAISSPSALADEPQNHLDAHEKEYRELLSYGEYTLQYCFSRFLQEDARGMKGQIMALACQDIMKRWGALPKLEYTSGQDWFLGFQSYAENLAQTVSAEDMEKYHPAAWMVLEMTKENLNRDLNCIHFPAVI